MVETFDLSRGPGGPRVRASRFAPPDGAAEVHLCLMPGAPAAFPRQLAELEEAYSAALGELGLEEQSVVVRRLFLSDAANQEERLAASPLARRRADNPAALSIVEQPPLPEGRVALWAYHLQEGGKGPAKEARPGGVLVRSGGRVHLWTTELPPRRTLAEADPAAQTREIFADYMTELAAAGATLADHVVRTWIFVDAVDLNYGKMVKARRELFAREGLTEETHYIASTGIAGRRADPRRIVTVEGYAVPGLRAEQVRHLEAPAMLGPTSAYGVTFERGTRIDLGDRRHLFISGTASIDNRGEVLHRGDVRAQAERTFANIEALLADGGAGFADLAQMVVYLRDPADREPVAAYLEEHFPRTPRILVHAPVCRPGWLIEVECWATLA